MKECLSVFDLSTVPMLTFALFYTSTQTSTGTTDNYIQLWHGETSSSHDRVWKASSAPTAVIPTVPISPNLAGTSQAGSLPPDGLV